MLAFDARPWLSELRVPTLVIASRDDPICPGPHSERLAGAIAGTELVMLEGTTHVPAVSGQPAAVDAVRAFLSERS